jgi:hypothetical protein
MGLFGRGPEGGRFQNRLEKIISAKSSSGEGDEDVAMSERIDKVQDQKQLDALRDLVAGTYTGEQLKIFTDLLNGREAAIRAKETREGFSQKI